VVTSLEGIPDVVPDEGIEGWVSSDKVGQGINELLVEDSLSKSLFKFLSIIRILNTADDRGGNMGFVLLTNSIEEFAGILKGSSWGSRSNNSGPTVVVLKIIDSSLLIEALNGVRLALDVEEVQGSSEEVREGSLGNTSLADRLDSVNVLKLGKVILRQAWSEQEAL